MMKFDSLKIDAPRSFDATVSNDLTKIVFFKRYSNQIAIFDANTSTWINTFVNKCRQVIGAYWVKEGVIFIEATCSEHFLWNYDGEIEIAHFIYAGLKNPRFPKKGDCMIAEDPWRNKINIYDTKTLSLIDSIESPCYCWVQELVDNKLIVMSAFGVHVYNLQGKILYHDDVCVSEIQSCTIYNQFFVKKTAKGDIIFTNMDDGKSFVHSDKRYCHQTLITMPSESILVIADKSVTITDRMESVRFCKFSNECTVIGKIPCDLCDSKRATFLMASSDDKKFLYREETQFNVCFIIDIWSPVSRALQKYMLPILNSRNISLDTRKVIFNAIASSLSIGNRLYKNKIDEWLRCARKVIVENH